MKIKLLVASHSESEKGEGILSTVTAGAALSHNSVVCDYADDGGENISALNPYYNEMTVVYWAWKNYSAIGTPDYLGLMHYRRYFYFDARLRDAVIRTSVPKELFSKKSKISEDHARLLLSSADFICPRPARRRSVEKQYAATHDKADIALVMEIINELCPEYSAAAERYFKGNNCFFFNMFVFPKELFFRYAEFIFPVLREFFERKGKGERLFISERLTGVFFQKLFEEGKRAVYLPVLYREGKGESKFSVFKKDFSSAKSIKAKLLSFRRLLPKRLRENRRI